MCLVCVMIGQFEDLAITSSNFQCSPNNNGCSGFFNPRSLFKVTSTLCINTALLLTDNKRLRMHTAIFFSTVRVHLKGERKQLSIAIPTYTTRKLRGRSATVTGNKVDIALSEKSLK